MNARNKIDPMSRVLRKSTVEVEITLEDGTNLSGSVFAAPGERVLDMLNATASFFPLKIETGDIVLVSKKSIVICKPLDRQD